MNILLYAIFWLEANVSTTETESLSKSCVLEFSVKQNIQAAGPQVCVPASDTFLMDHLHVDTILQETSMF